MPEIAQVVTTIVIVLFVAVLIRWRSGGLVIPVASGKHKDPETDKNKFNASDIGKITNKIWKRYTGEPDIYGLVSPAATVEFNSEALKQFPEIMQTAAKRENNAREEGKREAQSIQNKDRALAYAERIIDRLINKARGLLPFNSILIALLAAATKYFKLEGGLFEAIVGLSFVLLLLSSFLTLALYVVHWAEPKEFECFNSEFKGTIEIARSRSRTLQAAIICSFGGLACLLIIGCAATFKQLDRIVVVGQREKKVEQRETIVQDMELQGQKLLADVLEVKRAYEDLMQRARQLHALEQEKLKEAQEKDARASDNLLRSSQPR